MGLGNNAIINDLIYVTIEHATCDTLHNIVMNTWSQSTFTDTTRMFDSFRSPKFQLICKIYVHNIFNSNRNYNCIIYTPKVEYYYVYYLNPYA